VIILRRYIVMEERHFQSVALWIVLSHLLQRVDLGVNVAPRLAIQSPAPDCGKTTLLMLVAGGVPRDRMAGDISPASLFRLVDALHVSLLLDEADNMFNGISDQLLLQVVNSGHRRKTAFIERVDTLPDGTKKTVRFSTFTAIAYAGIKELPPTQQTRCIAIKLQAATAAESRKIEHLVNDDSPEMRIVCRKLIRWSADLKELPEIDRPVELLNRLGDNWYPMRQIAQIAGGAWPQRAFNAAQESKVNAADKGDLPALLASIHQIFREPPIERLQTGDIVQKLLAEPEGPWREKHKGKPINEYYLRDSLREVIPKDRPDLRKWKEGAKPARGYHHDLFLGPWERYLGVVVVPFAQTTSRQGGGSKYPPHPPHPPPEDETEAKSKASSVADTEEASATNPPHPPPDPPPEPPERPPAGSYPPDDSVEKTNPRLCGCTARRARGVAARGRRRPECPTQRHMARLLRFSVRQKNSPFPPWRVFSPTRAVGWLRSTSKRLPRPPRRRALNPSAWSLRPSKAVLPLPDVLKRRRLN
jgi:hypothetical protein